MPYRLVAGTFAVLALCSAAACSGSDEQPGSRPPDAASGATTSPTATVAPDDEPLFSSYRQPARCVARPKPEPTVARPPWLPARLPLPDGSYVVGELAPRSTHDSGLLAVPVSLDEWASMVRERWVAGGVVLGRRESEPGETEAAFVDGDVFGAYRARNLYCDDGWVQVLVIYGRQSEGP